MLKFTLLISLLLACEFVNAQTYNCGSDVLNQTRLSNPAYQFHQQQVKSTTRETLTRKRSARTQSTTIYTIPVVFHIMHRGETSGTDSNLSDESIKAAVKSMNERYRKISGSVGDGNSVDMQIQFALAVRDPNGNSTNAINHVDMTAHQDYMDFGVLGDGISDDDLKAISFWDSHRYLNIWAVTQIDGFGGYAYFADSHGATYDGVVLNYFAMGDPESAALTHEVGHYLDLRHTFEGDFDGTACPANNDCLFDGDLVCDTPPQIRYTPCELLPNACTPGVDYATTNYMSYSCMNEFTEGQKERVRNALEGPRASLLEVNGNAALVPIGPPVADFVVTSQGKCVGSEIRFEDRTPGLPNTLIDSPAGNATTFSWIMTDHNGINLTSQDQNASFIISLSSAYDVTLKVTTPGGTSSITKQVVVPAGIPILTSSCTAQTQGAIDYQSRTDDVGIREVNLGILHHVSGTTVEDVATGLTNENGYGDFSCLEVAYLKPGIQYFMSVLLSDYYNEGVLVYIDFNNNGITDEDLVTGAFVPAGSGIHNLPPFTTPSFGVVNTPLRMRVVDAESTDPEPTSCGMQGYYGQIHDYSVIVDNAIPIARPDDVTINEDGVATIDVLDNDTDADGTIVLVDFDPTINVQTSKTTNEGDWIINLQNRVVFTPKPNFFGVVSIQYNVVDNNFSESRPATITVTIESVDDVPEVVDDQATTLEDTDVTINVVANDTDVENDLNPASVDLDLPTSGIQNTLSTVEGKWSVNALGIVMYKPALNFNGTASIPYSVSDHEGFSSARSIITVTVTPVNDAPHLTDVSLTISGAIVNSDLTFGDTDPDDDGLVYSAISVSGPDHGIITITPEGKFSYTPSQGYLGDDVIVVAVCDDGMPTLCSVKTVKIQIIRPEVAPVANDDEATSLTNDDLLIQILANDTDENNDIEVTTVDLDPGTAGFQTEFVVNEKGKLTVDHTGVVTFTRQRFSGAVNFHYTISDTGGKVSNVALIRVTVDPLVVTGVGEIVSRNDVMFSPNPFQDSFLMTIRVNERSRVHITVTDILGRIVHKSAEETLNPGESSRVIDMHRQPAGIYIYSLTIGSEVMTGKMMKGL